MKLKQLKYFITVAEELHFGRAAQRLHISQPPLSISIQQLEDLLGFALFIRNNKNVMLTDAGTLFYQEALILLKHAEDMKQICEQVALGTLGQLRIGFSSSTLFSSLNQYITNFQNKYPQINIILKEMNSLEQIQATKLEQINLGFVHLYPQDDQLEQQLFLSEDFVCCLPKNHKFAQQILIDLKQLQYENFILFPRSIAPHYHDQIATICINAGFSPKLTHEVRNWLTIIQCVEVGLGVAIVPQSMQILGKGDLQFIPIENNKIRSDTYCIWKKNKTSIVLNNFIDSLTFV